MTEINTPDWLIDAAPGAREAANAYLAALANGTRLRRAHGEAIQANRPLARPVRQGELGPARGVTTVEFDEAQQRLTNAKLATDANTRKVKALLAKYREIVRKFPATQRIPLAATIAIAKHERAVELWTELAHVLDERDEAWVSAGRPGIPWETQNGVEAGGASNLVSRFARLMDAGRVGGWDLDAVKRLLDGKEIGPVKVPQGTEIHPVGNPVTTAAFR